RRTRDARWGDRTAYRQRHRHRRDVRPRRRRRRNQRTRRRDLRPEIQGRELPRHRHPPELRRRSEAERVPRRRTASHRAPGFRDLLGTGQGWLYGSLLRDDRNGSLRVRLPDVARAVAGDAARSLAVRDAWELRLLLRTAVRPAPGGRSEEHTSELQSRIDL